MPAASIDRGTQNRIDLVFEPFALPGAGRDVSGQMLLMTQSITIVDKDHDTKDQTFMLADGSGKRWLAHRYEYTRQPVPK